MITVIATGLQEERGGFARTNNQFGTRATGGVSIPGFLSGNYSAPATGAAPKTERGAMDQFDYTFDPNATRPKTTVPEYKPAGTNTFTNRPSNPMFGKQDNATDGEGDKIKIPPFIQNYTSKKK